MNGFCIYVRLTPHSQEVTNRRVPSCSTNGRLIQPVFQASMKPMKEVALLLQDMVSAGVITGYAVFGAVAQMRYTEAVLTEDADVLVEIPGEHGLDVLAPIYAYCRSRGLSFQGQWIRVGSWPVHFVPPYSRITEAALREAVVEDFEGVPLRVVRADFLAMIAPDTGRPKDFDLITRMMEAGAIGFDGLQKLADRHGLSGKLRAFRSRYRK